MYQDNFSTPDLTQSSPPTRWNRYEDKLFEKALVMFPEDFPDRWQKIAEHVGRSVQEVTEHYEILVHDVYEIDSGRVELPSYADEFFESSWESPMAASNQISFGSQTKQGDAERKKGKPWTEEEHRLFLIGLNTFGKGDWRSISRNVVKSRNPTQVASHAQKYFLRQNSVKKERKRSSIHDITTVDNNSVAPHIDKNWIAPPGGASVSVLQEMPLASHLHDQRGSMVYQNYGFPM
ncbi:hypothetical protein JCGZ_24140 [Jatropha curcas]|uniref:MYB family protein n=1 Tax=Jatropha curcas TaxID=180498 RepID=A0A067L5I9_JATCU|nr:transcription factor SRM1 [Jatropha curcas]KDP43682.1 hypothetical protein JCGZ_24140 [Jatropha curcas]